MHWIYAGGVVALFLFIRSMWGFITVVASKVPDNSRSMQLHKLLLGKVDLILFVL